MEKRIKCLRCGRPMELLRREHLQMGKTGVDSGRPGQPAVRRTGCGQPGLPRLREAEIFPGRLVRGEEFGGGRDCPSQMPRLQPQL